jgi:hypothetical protein
VLQPSELRQGPVHQTGCAHALVRDDEGPSDAMLLAGGSELLQGPTAQLDDIEVTDL